MTREKTKKNEIKYICKNCNYITFKKTDYNGQKTLQKKK